MSAQKARTTEQKLVRKKILLASAEALFVQSDRGLPTISQIAEQSKLAKGTVYLYFQSKEHVFLELAEQFWLKTLYIIDEGFKKRTTEHRPFMGLNILVEYWLSHPHIPRLLVMRDSVLCTDLPIDIIHRAEQPRRAFWDTFSSFHGFDKRVDDFDFKVNALTQIILYTWQQCSQYGRLKPNKTEIVNRVTPLLISIWQPKSKMKSNAESFKQLWTSIFR